MKIVITGGGGFLGKKLAQRLLSDGTVAGASGRAEPISELVLFDVERPQGPFTADKRVRCVAGDIANSATVSQLVTGASSIFHLAAVVSSGAEADFDLGYRVNLDGTRYVLEAARALGTCPRVIFTSSLAAYGGELPPAVTDETPLTPQTSYGTQKSIGEFLVRDYTRKGFIRGTSIRLPTICVRTGRPNKAASTWASSIIREPLTGIDTVCPVTRETPMAILSPRKTIDAFIRAHALDAEAYGPGRFLQLNGFSATAAELVAAMERHAGNRKIGKVAWEHDPAIQKIVDGWPGAIDSKRARTLGFEMDRDIDEVVQNFIADDLDEQIKSVAA
jgi:nucleoside-diphosphate-sugar epimerase